MRGRSAGCLVKVEVGRLRWVLRTRRLAAADLGREGPRLSAGSHGLAGGSEVLERRFVEQQPLNDVEVGPVRITSDRACLGKLIDDLGELAVDVQIIPCGVVEVDRRVRIARGIDVGFVGVVGKSDERLDEIVLDRLVRVRQDVAVAERPR